MKKATQDKSRSKIRAFQPPRQLIAAVFTPFTQQYDVNLKVIDRYAEFLAKEGVAGVFVCGTTGEGLSLTTRERFDVAERWVRACGGKMRVFIHVGNECQKDACALASHAQDIGAGAVAAIGPNFFKPRSLEELVDYSSAIAAAAPESPFYYYHIPAMTGLRFRMINFLTLAAEQIPTLAGIKFTDEDLMDFGLCSQFKRGRFDIVFGRDEILLSALALGARKAIGSTYNFFAPSYLKITKAFEEGDVESAREEQSYAMKMIQILCRYGSIPAGKAIMRMRGIDCGPVRPPLTLSTGQANELKRDLEAINFFDHINMLQKR